MANILLSILWWAGVGVSLFLSTMFWWRISLARARWGCVPDLMQASTRICLKMLFCAQLPCVQSQPLYWRYLFQDTFIGGILTNKSTVSGAMRAEDSACMLVWRWGIILWRILMLVLKSPVKKAVIPSISSIPILVTTSLFQPWMTKWPSWLKGSNHLSHLPIIVDVLPHVVQQDGVGGRVPGHQVVEAGVAVIEETDNNNSMNN